MRPDPFEEPAARLLLALRRAGIPFIPLSQWRWVADICVAHPDVPARMEIFERHLEEGTAGQLILTCSAGCGHKRISAAVDGFVAEWDRRWNGTARQKPRARFAPGTSRQPSYGSADDPLRRIPTSEYVALAGVELNQSGYCCCVFADHEDRSPSFRQLPDDATSFYCYGCHRGGTIYDFCSHLWGVSTKGSSFKKLRVRIAGELLGARFVA